ncbi:MAG: UDP-N-acetylenolpyruvoylglucosamine reductase [Candidatus Adlerbacteria bacterium GW2011_GWC1_50_9]|uniref:UDP-N-acetylenolpyruvoylglucosamine reductase n=1 Tax=Candidatus Adlerbacteria bacterium GW2011_GWC1_50_9 TaxID=1618608 RepID=A0A0G1YTC1_9BACT|nr:MAG: UDP-N-acetylenolpyruvoylglucosamine reductase [Candidatus Adlerbacteria bacterium GW2011_GWC1_50_9]
MEMKENVSLKPFTVFQVGGPARFFAETRSKEEVIEALGWAKEKQIPSFILGLGSNVLVSDRGFPGLVIKISGGKVSRDGALITAEAGAKMAEVVNFSLQNGLVGFEWAIGVPGTIGGSVRGNAGCFGSEMKDFVAGADVFDANAGRELKLSNSECRFSYRQSIFKEKPEFVVLGVSLRLKSGGSGEAKERFGEFVKARVQSQDIGSKTAGCVFKNPSAEIRAGALVDKAGLKGTSIGGAAVSEKHANFIINTGAASAEDIVMLIGLIKERVHRKFDVFLEEEIQYVGF